MGEAMRKCAAASEAFVIPAAPHMMQRANPAGFNAAVLGFLARN